MPEEEIENQAESDEDDYAQALRQERAATQTIDEIGPGDETAPEIGRENAETNPIGSVVMVVDILSDAFDYTGIAAIPILGDILDVATAGFNLIVLWQTKKEVRMKVILVAVVSPVLIETFGAFVAPVLNDLLPSYIVGSLIGRMIINRAIKKAGLKNNA